MNTNVDDAPRESVDHYTLLQVLGRGSMGTVFLARDERTGQRVALKLFHAHLRHLTRERELFFREIGVMKAFDHPLLVRILDQGWTGDLLYLTMDYCDQGNVAALATEHRGCVPIDQAVGIVLQVLEGLEYAHAVLVPSVKKIGGFTSARGVVHRDIKPSNILLCTGPNGLMARIGDFGLAKAFDLAGLTALTRTGATGGTPPFASRQQAINFKRVLPEVDVWATAATLYFMLTGCTPRDFPESIPGWKIVTDTAPIPVRCRNPDIPEQLANVLDTALDDRSDLRFTTAAQLKECLRTTMSV